MRYLTVLVLFLVITGGVAGQTSAMGQNTANSWQKARQEEAEKRTEFLQETQDRIKELKQLREENRMEIRERLRNLADERKIQVAERVGQRLCEARSKRVEKLSEHLQKMSEIVDRVETKTNQMEQDGKNVAEIRTEITEARSAISAGRTAIETFAAKDCGLNLSGSESQLKNEMGAAIRNLEKEFKALQVKLTEARKATSEAIRTMARVNNEGNQ